MDVRNIAALSPATVRPLPVDQTGLVLDRQLDGCDCIYVTPSHQSPTTVTMPLDNRYRLLEQACTQDILVIEDDYESELNYQSDPLPALKSLDNNDRVIYVGSLSKTIAPGLRIGFVVGARELIAQLRALRRLMLRHPATNNQHTLALFLARGYHDSLVRKLLAAYTERHRIMARALAEHLPECRLAQGFGGSSFWVEGPGGLDCRSLARRAADAGLVIEPGDIFFQQPNPPLRYFRLGFSAIGQEQIEPGVRLLAGLMAAGP